MEDIKKERFISKNHTPVSIERTEEILNQMKNSVCKIYKGGFIGTGFFCKKKLNSTKKDLYALITNNHVLNENNIKLDSTFSLSIGDNDNQMKNIKISSNRKHIQIKIWIQLLLKYFQIMIISQKVIFWK